MILELLAEKKHFLIEFNKINLQSLALFQKSNFDNIEFFYNSRESLLEIIKYIDQKIENLARATLRLASTPLAVGVSSSLNQHHPKGLSQEDAKMVAFIKLEIKALTQDILNQDMQILALMDSEKSSIIKELQSIGKNKKHFSSYKTKISYNKVDEEA